MSLIRLCEDGLPPLFLWSMKAQREPLLKPTKKSQRKKFLSLMWSRASSPAWCDLPCERGYCLCHIREQEHDTWAAVQRRLPWQQPLGSSCWWSQKCSISSLLLMAYVFFVELLLIQHILSPKQTLIKASFSTQGSSWISILNFLTRAVDLVTPLFTR